MLAAVDGGTTTLSGARARFARGWREVGPRVWAWLQPNGGWGEANAGLVAGEDASLLVDTLWDERLARAMLSEGAGLGAPPIATVVNTHADGDHWWGNATVPVEAEIVTSASAAAAMREESSPQELARLARLSQRAHWLPGRAGALTSYVDGMLAPFHFADVKPRYPDRTFTGTDALTVGGRQVRLLEVGPAHTVGDLAVHVPDAAVVFAADVLFVGVVPVMWHGPIDGWVAALDRLLELDAEIYVPGHGPPCGPDGVRRMRDLMAWTGEAARAHQAAGRSPLEATRTMLADDAFAPYRDWDGPERLYITVAAIYRGAPLSTAPAGRAKVLSVVGRLARELRRR